MSKSLREKRLENQFHINITPTYTYVRVIKVQAIKPI